MKLEGKGREDLFKASVILLIYFTCPWSCSTEMLDLSGTGLLSLKSDYDLIKRYPCSYSGELFSLFCKGGNLVKETRLAEHPPLYIRQTHMMLFLNTESQSELGNYFCCSVVTFSNVIELYLFHVSNFICKWRTMFACKGFFSNKKCT